MTPVQALLAILRDEGVDRVFGNPGTTELPLTDALVDASDLPYVLGLHEGPLVAMADGFARATRRPSFVNLHIAAGLANGLIGLLNARRSRTPMVVTAGQQDRRHLVDDPMLSADLVGLAQAATKSAVEVQHARDLPVVLRRAFAEAVRPPAGPVFVSIPMDLLEEETEVPVPQRIPMIPAQAAAGIAELAGRLAAAANPVIVAGDGVGREGAMAELTAVAEALGAAVLHQPMADTLNFPADHPLHVGMPLPTYTDIRRRLSPYDVIVIVGARAFTPHHYTPDEPIPSGATVVQIDSDPAEVGRNIDVHFGLVGDLRTTLAALAAELPGRVERAAQRRYEVAVATSAARTDLDAEARAAYGSAPMHPLAAVHAIAGALRPDAVVVEEAITSGLLLRRVLRQRLPGSYVHATGGGLGWGIGAAIGTKMGHPDRPVVAVLGDGCATFGIHGLWTAARHRVPVCFVVMNNGEYRTLKDTLDRRKSRSTETAHYVGLDLRDPNLDWAGAGQFFGVPTVRVSDCDELAATVASAPSLAGPLLVEVPVTGHSPAPSGAWIDATVAPASHVRPRR